MEAGNSHTVFSEALKYTGWAKSRYTVIIFFSLQVLGIGRIHPFTGHEDP
jgi:hypothetical protein